MSVFTHLMKEQNDIIWMTKYIVVVTNLILIAPESQFFLYFWIMFKQINSLFIEDFFHIIKIEKKSYISLCYWFPF